MSEARKVLREALILGAIAVLTAAAVHVPLIVRFARGEFRETFFPAGDYPGIRMIALEEAEDLWREGRTAVLDARAAAAFERGHVPGARNVPAAETGGTIPADLLGAARDRTLVVYCEGGDCLSSLILARRLHDEGFRDIRVFSGGWEAWTAAGLPEEKTDTDKDGKRDDGRE